MATLVSTVQRNLPGGLVLRVGSPAIFKIIAVVVSSTSILLHTNLAKMDTFSKFKLYRNVEGILEDLNKYKSLKPVEDLLKIYNNARAKYENHREERQHPLIVLEGLDGSGKSSMTRTLAKKLHGYKWQTPPESVKALREYFDYNPDLRTAFYSLGNYIAGYEIGCLLHEKPVFLDRCWNSTTAFALGQSVARDPTNLTLPEEGDDVYKWPDDLLKPNKVILLQVSEAVRLERHSRRGAEMVTPQEKLLTNDKEFRDNVIRAYKNMRDPKITFVDGDKDFGKTLYMLKNLVTPLLKT
ncbi:UMP-CMP kinase 2, mitochondrial-like [Anthonomus grandis grandis]|uniref:UMP-CMP kinase 2, mitochondrial-like n=1 Tax=Anthonomus grandis grandis TaxID=2921223 RepID=UPI0021667B62|nr:UMP-CMP kinase 2, mitochondrial-like [Anthonomus grandis grandis]